MATNNQIPSIEEELSELAGETGGCNDSGQDPKKNDSVIFFGQTLVRGQIVQNDNDSILFVKQTYVSEGKNHCGI